MPCPYAQHAFETQIDEKFCFTQTYCYILLKKGETRPKCVQHYGLLTFWDKISEFQNYWKNSFFRKIKKVWVWPGSENEENSKQSDLKSHRYKCWMLGQAP